MFDRLCVGALPVRLAWNAVAARWTRKFLGFCLQVTLLVTIQVSVEPACAATEPGPPHGEVIRNDIIGVVLYPDGETPVTDLPVKVWGLDEKKMVYRTKTDRMGVFRIPKLNTDRFYIFVGSVKIDIRILASRADALVQHHDIVVIAARPIVIARPMFFDLIIGPSLLLFPDENVASP